MVRVKLENLNALWNRDETSAERILKLSPPHRQVKYWNDQRAKHALIRQSHGLKQSGTGFKKLKRPGQNRRAGLDWLHRDWPHATASPLSACQENFEDLKD